jgi:hypothetical protein
MSEKVFVKGPNGLVIGHKPDVAAGLLRHPDHKKVAAPEAPAAEVPTGEVPVDPDAATPPAGNASKEAWHAYALDNGKTSADLDGLGQREIRALFTEA